MAMLFDDVENRDRRLATLLQTATQLQQLRQQKQIADQENQYRLQQMAVEQQGIVNDSRKMDLADPSKNKYLRSELATQNRLRMAQSQSLTRPEMPTQKESPFRANAKDKRTEKLLETVNQNAVQRDMVSAARESVKRLNSGVYGKVTRGFEKRLSPDSPGLADYQTVKSVLTDAQLRESMVLKGAISDTENKWLADASANDDLLSSPRAGVIFDKMLKKMDAEENAQLQTYKRAYGEDPSEWEEIRNLRTKREVGIDLGSIKKALELAGINLDGATIKNIRIQGGKK